MATENWEMTGDADRNGEAEVRQRPGGARYKAPPLASCSVMLNHH